MAVSHGKSKTAKWQWALPSGHTYDSGMVDASPATELLVEPDRFLITVTDVVLTARLDGTFALCFYDAVEAAGGIVHLNSSPAGRMPVSELTDTTLSSDLLLIDRCVETLQRAAPRAQHWQVRLVSHALQPLNPFLGIRELLEGVLQDFGIHTASCQLLEGSARVVHFRPLMGELAIAPQP